MAPSSQYAPLTQLEEGDSEAPTEQGDSSEEQQPLRSTKAGGSGGGGSLRSLLAVRHYWKLFAAGTLFDGSRASLLFLTSLYVTQATGSPRFVQLTGVCLNLMLLCGPLFGIISDRYDRRRTVVMLLAAMSALTFSVSALLALGLLPWQLIYPVCIFCGLANVLDTTNRPALIFDLLHAQNSSENLSNAMALRSLGAGVGGALGVWVVGVVVELAGVWLGFAIVGVQMTVAMLLLCTVPSQPPARKKGAGGGGGGGGGGGKDESKPPSVCADLKAGLWLAYNDTRLASILSVTIIANLLFFSHTPILQLLAVDLGK
jgi:MFS family permease